MKKKKAPAARRAPPKEEAEANGPDASIGQNAPESEPAADLKPPAEPKAPTAPKSAPEPAPEKNKNGLLKLVAVGLLLVATIALAYYFFIMPENTFMAGTPVDEETFKGLFLDATDVYIVMDVRGISEPGISDNVMQCGVDFAASSGMGGKTVTPLAIGDDGCISPDGPTPLKDCLAMMESGISVYVKGGDGGARYYDNGMVVTVGKEYAVGTCGIKRAG
ncbi:MAG: hypothetical protein V1827_01285 [Candidatus Micrarchaeota archaeon]